MRLAVVAQALGSCRIAWQAHSPRTRLRKTRRRRVRVADPERGRTLWLAAMPFVFVLLWSTGFIVAKMAAPYAPPLTFLLLRFAGVVVVLLPLAWLTRAPWPQSPRAWFDTAVVGLLLQATYLGGVWLAIALGMPAGVSSLLVGTQPLLTALFGATVGERVSRLQWLGLVLGIVGIALVLSDRLTLAGVGVARPHGERAGAARHHRRHPVPEAARRRH